MKGHRKPARQVDFYANFRVKAFLSNSRLAESIIKLNFQYQFGYTIVQYFSTPPFQIHTRLAKKCRPGVVGNST